MHVDPRWIAQNSQNPVEALNKITVKEDSRRGRRSKRFENIRAEIGLLFERAVAHNIVAEHIVRAHEMESFPAIAALKNIQLVSVELAPQKRAIIIQIIKLIIPRQTVRGPLHHRHPII